MATALVADAVPHDFFRSFSRFREVFYARHSNERIGDLH
jgi:hypothetical protein